MYLLLKLGQFRPLLAHDTGNIGSTLALEVTVTNALQHEEEVSGPRPFYQPIILKGNNALLLQARQGPTGAVGFLDLLGGVCFDPSLIVRRVGCSVLGGFFFEFLRNAVSNCSTMI